MIHVYVNDIKTQNKIKRWYTCGIQIETNVIA